MDENDCERWSKPWSLLAVTNFNDDQKVVMQIIVVGELKVAQ